MKLDFLLTSAEKKEIIDIELKEDYYDLWGYRGVISFLIPLIVFYMPLTVFMKEGYSKDFVVIFKLAFIVYGGIALLLKGIEITVRKYIYMKRRKQLINVPCEDEKYHVEVRNATIFFKGNEENKVIKMSDIIDVLEIDSYLAICYGQYGEYIFIPLKEFNDGRLYNFLANINKNLK